MIHRAGKPNLFIVPAGPPPPSPSSLLEVKRGSGLVSGLLPRAILVNLDPPRSCVGADAASMANWTDGVLIMIDLSKSSHHGVANALKQIHAVHANPVGFVVNRDKSAVGGGYGYYQYGYENPPPGSDRAAEQEKLVVPGTTERVG